MELAKKLFVEIDKFYRADSFYEGRRSPLEARFKAFDTTVSKLREDKLFTGGGVRYDLLLDAVEVDGSKVFTSERPDLSFIFLLYSEGIKSIHLSKLINSDEFYRWAELLRRVEDGVEGEEDLASTLWRASFRNIRVDIINGLMEEGEFGGPVPRFRLDPLEEDLLSSRAISEEALDSAEFSEIQRIKKELSDVAVRESAVNLSLSSDERQRLAQEMSHLDYGQFDKNFIAQIFSALYSEELAQDERLKLETLLSNTIIELLERFSCSAISFALSHLEEYKEKLDCHDVYDKLVSKLQSEFTKEETIRALCYELHSEQNRPYALKLVQYLGSEASYPLCCNLISQQRVDLLEEVFVRILSAYPDVPERLLKLPVSQLTEVIPLLGRRTWSRKHIFFAKVLRSKNKDLLKLGLKRIHRMLLKANEAITLFSSLDKILQKAWLRQLRESPVQEVWREFVTRIVSDEHMLEFDTEAQLLSIECLIKYLGTQSVEHLIVLSRKKRLVFIKLYPRLKQQSLLAAVNVGDMQTHEKIKKAKF